MEIDDSNITDNDFEYGLAKGAITMFDEDGNEVEYNMLAAKKDGNALYMLVEAELDEEFDESEVLIFKCIDKNDPGTNQPDEDMVFELVDENHGSFKHAFELFKEDLDTLGVEY